MEELHQDISEPEQDGFEGVNHDDVDDTNLMHPDLISDIVRDIVFKFKR